MKIKNELIVICFILFILISISAVSAENNNTAIITTNNADDGNLTIKNEEILADENTGSFTDLNTTINGDSSKNIILDKDYIYSDNDNFKDGIIIESGKDNIVIDGNGHVIDAKSNSRMFKIYGNDITLKNIKFINGNSDYGGAIYGYGDNLIILNCTFIDNAASKEGGAIYDYPDTYTSIINSIFINNEAGEGGAIIIREEKNGTSDIINCSFIGNNANLTKWEHCGGGAIAYMDYFNMQEAAPNKWDTNNRIIGSIFLNNTAKSGGAIYNVNNYYINITNCIFIDNSALAIESSARHVDADYNWFGNTVDNMAEKPSVDENVYIHNWLYLDVTPHVESSSATISINNIYDNKTGETRTYLTSNLPSINVTFNAVNAVVDSNQVILDHTGKTEAGFKLLGDCEVTANYSTIKVSKKIKAGSFSELQRLITAAGDGSEIVLSKDYSYLKGIDNLPNGISILKKHNIIIDGNGSVLNANGFSRIFYIDKDSTYITLKNMIISNGNSRRAPGGAIYVNSDYFDLINCTFINNTAEDEDGGGAVYGHDTHSHIIDCKFINNTHTFSAGGAICWYGNDLTIKNTIFDNNMATDYGGALSVSGRTYVLNSTFINNIGDYGGAIHNYYHMDVDGCTFINNKASTTDYYYGGGAIYTINSTITNSMFIENGALVAPAIFVDGVDTFVDKCIFLNNTAYSGNGIVRWFANGGKLSNSIFLGNRASYGQTVTNGFGNLLADNNWLGNTAFDYNKKPDISNLANCNKWLFLNVTQISYDFETGDFKATLGLFEYDNITKQIIHYDLNDVPSFDLTLSAQNVTLDKNVVKIGEEITGKASSNKGILTAKYETVNFVFPFKLHIETSIVVNSTITIIKDTNQFITFSVDPLDEVEVLILKRYGGFTYESNDTSIADIVEYDYKGLITGWNTGVAKITIKFNGKTTWGEERYTPCEASVIVKVVPIETHIEFVSLPNSVLVGETVKIDRVIKDYRNNTVRGKLNIISNDTGIVKVDEMGNIIAVGNGAAKLTFIYEGDKGHSPSNASVVVYVGKIATKVTTDIDEIELFVGNTTVVNYNLVSLNNNKKFTSNNFTITSSDENVVRVYSGGRINAVSEGKATLTLNFLGSDAYIPSSTEIQVIVKKIPTGIDVINSIALMINENEILPATLNPAEAGSLTFRSSNQNVVKIDRNGKITAVGVGQANITVTFAGNNKYESASETVSVSVYSTIINTNISVNKTIEIYLPDPVNIGAILTPANAGNLTYVSSNSRIVKVDKNGLITGVNEGEANITVSFAGVNNRFTPATATVLVKVSKMPTTITSDSSITLNLTERTKINYVFDHPEAGSVKFEIENPDIVSIRNGYVSGNAVGKTNVTIVFSGNSKYKSSNFTILINVIDIETSIEASDIKVNLSETVDIGAVLTPAVGKLTYEILNQSVVSVKNGKVTGLEVGETDIIIKFNQSGKYRQSNKTIHVTVSKIETAITVNNESVSLFVDDKFNIIANLTPILGEFIYSSNNDSVAYVDGNGQITAIGEGTAIITVSYYPSKEKFMPANKTISVTVSRIPSEIICDSNMDMEIGLNTNIPFKINPYVDSSLLIYTTNSSIVELNNGNILSLNGGTALVNIYFEGNEKYLPSNASIIVYVHLRETSIGVSDNIVIGYSESSDLGAKVVSKYKTFDADLSYESSNPEIVSVDSKGHIIANAIGNATITIKYAGQQSYLPSNKTVNVEVTTKTTHTKVDKNSVSLLVDYESQISATVTDGPGNEKLNYISSNPNVATVDENGKIIAKGEGTATISVIYPGNDEYHSSYDNVTVTVSRHTTRIVVDNSFNLVVYENKDLYAVITPTNDGILHYTSSDDSIVSVNSTGGLTAYKPGNAIITIKFDGNSKYLPCEKEVIVSVGKIPTSLNLTDMTLNAGEEFDLGNIISPEGAPTRVRYYEFISMDTEIFDVDNGVITTFQNGVAELYVEFKGNDIYLPTNKSVIVTVIKKVLEPGEYNVTVEVDDDAGQATFTFTLPEDAEGSFIVNLNGQVYGEVIENGKAVVVIDELEPGDYKANLRYGGDIKYASISNTTKFHVGKYKIDKNKDIEVSLGSTATYTVHLTKDTQAMENKTITFKVNGKIYYAVTDMLGYASIKVKLPASKAYTVTAEFGSVKVSNKIKVHVIVAKNLNAKKTKNLKIQVSLKKVNNKYLSNKKVTLKFNGKTYTAKTNKKAVATFTINKNALSKLKVGKSYNYVVKYAKDSLTKKITIKK